MMIFAVYGEGEIGIACGVSRHRVSQRESLRWKDYRPRGLANGSFLIFQMKLWLHILTPH
jgi:hypothetical protein